MIHGKGIYRQSSCESDERDVNEYRRTKNPNRSNRDSQQRQGYSVRMPTAPLPRVREIVHCGPEFVGPQNGEDAEGEEKRGHNQCRWCIRTSRNCQFHVQKCSPSIGQLVRTGFIAAYDSAP